MLTRRLMMRYVAIGAGMAIMPVAAVAGQTKPEPAPEIDFAEWTEDEAGYVFYPGDKLEVRLRGAPELSQTTQVGPDGRITLPQIGSVMAAHQSVASLQEIIRTKYAAVLIAPEVTVLPLESAPLRVLVGGEVKNPGWVDMGAELDGLSAVMAAGGFTHAAKSKKVVLLRRSPDGRAMRRIIDLKSPLTGSGDKLYALRRNDLVFVPRTNVAEAGVFVEQYVNNLIPGAILNYFSYRTFN